MLEVHKILLVLCLTYCLCNKLKLGEEKIKSDFPSFYFLLEEYCTMLDFIYVYKD